MKHIIVKLGRIFALQAVAFAGFFAISVISTVGTISTVNAQMPAQPKSLWAESNKQVDDATVVKDARRDPNKYCVDCHSSATHIAHTGKPFTHFGKHFQKETASPNNGQPLNCVSCHGNISEDHRKGVKDVMRFNAFGKAHNPALERTAQEQNQVCFACHNPEKLREVFWAHDTHANKMSCVNCHQLHPEQEPMKALDSKQRVKLCVECHSKIHQKKSSTIQINKDKQ